MKSDRKISALEGGFGGTLVDSDRFGVSIAVLPSGSGVPDLAVGADGDDGLDTEHGLVWLLDLNGRPGPYARRR